MIVKWFGLAIVLPASVYCGQIFLFDLQASAAPVPVKWNLQYIQSWFTAHNTVTQDAAHIMEFQIHPKNGYAPPPETIVVEEDGREKSVELITCADVLKYIPHVKTIQVQSNDYDPTIEELGTRCNAFERLARLKPAQTSYLRLPSRPLIGLLAQVKLLAKDPKDAAIFDDLKHPKKIYCPNRDFQDICTVDFDGGLYIIRVLAVGDYNGDGIGDLLITVLTGRYDSDADPRFVGVVLTQLSKHGKPIALDWWDWHG